MRYWMVAFGLACAMSLSACGDDGGDGTNASPEGFNTSVDETITLGQLSPQQAQSFCDEVATYEADVLLTDEDRCTMLMTYGDSPPAECQAGVSSCLEDPSDARDEYMTLDTREPCDVSLLSEISECTLTVGDLESCHQEVFRGARADLDRLSCENTAPFERLVGDAQYVGPACEKIADQCLLALRVFKRPGQ